MSETTVQATLASFDPVTRAGTALLADGIIVDFDGAAFRAGGLRLLRPGQRVRLRRGPTGTVTAVLLPADGPA